MANSSIISKSTALLDAVCASATPLTFTQIGNATGLHKSSTHRILSILMQERLLAFDPDRRTYQPGPRLVGWAACAFRTNDLPGLAGAAMEALCDKTGAHVALSILEGSSVLYLKTVNNTTPYRLAPRVGERSPVHACAAGKALLAYQRPQEREAMLQQIDLERFTEFTITTPQALDENLRQVRERGFALCDREEFLQVAGISAPLFGHHGDVVAAISLWNVVERQDIKQLSSYRTELISVTKSLSARLGFEAPASGGA